MNALIKMITDDAINRRDILELQGALSESIGLKFAPEVGVTDYGVNISCLTFNDYDKLLEYLFHGFDTEHGLEVSCDRGRVMVRISK